MGFRRSLVVRNALRLISGVRDRVIIRPRLVFWCYQCVEERNQSVWVLDIQGLCKEIALDREEGLKKLLQGNQTGDCPLVSLSRKVFNYPARFQLPRVSP
jgi:hypothetical protein